MRNGLVPMQRSAFSIPLPAGPLVCAHLRARRRVRVAFATNRRGRRLFGETCEWFDSHDNTWVFSFENICYALDLVPDHIREGLTRWRQEQARRRPVAAAPHPAAAYRLRRAAG